MEKVEMSYHPHSLLWDPKDNHSSGSEASYDGSSSYSGHNTYSSRDDSYKEKERNRDRERRRDRHDRDRDRDRRQEPEDRDRSRDRYENKESGYSSSSSGETKSSVLSSSGSSISSTSSYVSPTSVLLREDRAGEKWMTESPTNTVLLRGLPSQVDEQDIRAELMIFGVPIKEVRLMKNKATGTSRGFAFVEFQSVEDAQRWMEMNQGKLVLLNQYPVNMYYSTPRSGELGNQVRDLGQKTDWMCTKCGAHNFRRRDYCFKCSISREESEKTTSEDGNDQVGSNPCNTIILRGLDALTSEESIIASLNTITALPIKNVCVIKDEVTNTSKGYAFLEMNSLRESSQLLEMLSRRSGPLEVDGKAVLVSYAKNTYSTVMTTLSSPPAAQYPQSQTWDYSQYYQGSSYNYPAGYDQSQYYSQSSYDTTSYYNYDQSYYQQTTSTATTTQSQPKTTTATAQPRDKKKTQTDRTNAAAAVAQAAIQQAHAAKQYHKQQEDVQKHLLQHMQHQQKLSEMSQEVRLAHEAQAWSQHSQDSTDAADDTKYPTYPVPDVSTYQYDETSGYYYDPLTGLYYDATTQYYYNSETGQFLYWDSEKSTYLPSPTDQDEKDDGRNRKDSKDNKKEKVKIAKKIAKDMEKWAKSLNAQKEAMVKDGKKPVQTIVTGGAMMSTFVNDPKKESATADAGWAMLEKRPDEKKMMPPPSMGGQDASKAQQKGALVASYGGDSDSEEEDDSSNSNGDRYVDLKKMACLLCKRQFPTKEALTRHQQLSDLHKKNLEAAKAKHAAEKLEAHQYRDRAKERRDKFGIPTPPEPRKKRQYLQMKESIFEQPTKEGIQKDNIGSKMLEKMGWSQGQGLGKKGQGIVNPIEAKKRQMSAGLGMRGSSYDVSATDSYKDAVKKTMFARYHEGVE